MDTQTFKRKHKKQLYKIVRDCYDEDSTLYRYPDYMVNCLLEYVSTNDKQAILKRAIQCGAKADKVDAVVVKIIDYWYEHKDDKTHFINSI